MFKPIHFIAACCLMLVATVASAQVTTAGMSGRVSADNESLIGATIQATHVPSGTFYGAVTNSGGRYTIQGLRAGGPYTITVSYVGYESQTFNNIELTLGETFTIDVELKESKTLLDDVVVKANRLNSTGQHFDSQRIQHSPTVSRSVYDVVKNAPLVTVSKKGGISIAGANNRYNSFQIDGTVSNDVFGLADSGTNGGQTLANPISLDAIGQIQVQIAPYDVRQSGFTGGAINAVTKSGTNEFHGSAYGFYNNQDMYGRYNAAKDNVKDKMTKQYDETFGATLGGPIIKDKLFFFTSAEYKKNSYPGAYYAGMNDATYYTVAQIRQAAERYTELTGFQESFGQKDILTQGLGLLARVDWNINEKNKFSLRYQYNGSSTDKGINTYNTLFLENSGYLQSNRTHSFVAELHTQLTDAISNEARLNYTRVRDWRDVPYQGPAAYVVNAHYGDKTDGNISMGTEYSSAVNDVDQDNWSFEDNLSFYLGDHTLTVGTHEEFFNTRNGYIQYANGLFYYNNIENFLNNQADYYYYNYSDEALTGTSRWRAKVHAGQFGFYAQDKWDVNSALQLTYGLRVDAPVFFNSPTTNDEFNQSAAATTYNVEVGKMPGVKLLLSPRVGFRWYTGDDKTTLLRGGTGLFTGRVPFVWLSNCYANTAMEMKGTTQTPVLHQLDEWQKAMEVVRGGESTVKQSVNTVSKDFRYPQTWRSNLAIEHTFPFGLKATLEGLYSHNLHAVFFENLALQGTGNHAYVVDGVAASSVPYYNANAGKYDKIINLRSIDKGYAYSLTTKLEQHFDFGLDLTASYTYGVSKSVNDGFSSVAASNWKNYTATDVNKPELGYSLFDTPHRIQFTAFYTTRKYAQGQLNTEVALTYNGSNGMRYSLTMAESTSSKNNNKASFNGDSQAGNIPLYIPTESEMGQMSFASDADKAQFGEWIASDSYARHHRGQFAERFGSTAPWENHFDFHLAENFFYNKKGGKITLSFDVINAANMLNKEWGLYYAYTTAVSPLKVESVTVAENGDRTGTFSFTGNTEPTKDGTLSRFHAQIGLKVTF